MKLQIQIILCTININDIVNMNNMRKNNDIFEKKLYIKLKNIKTVLSASVTTLVFNIENYTQIDTALFIKKIIS